MLCATPFAQVNLNRTALTIRQRLIRNRTRYNGRIGGQHYIKRSIPTEPKT